MKKQLIFIGTIFIILTLIALWFQGAINETKRPILNNDSVNNLFSGLAFLGLIITILIQQKQIDESKKDLENQRKIDMIARFENVFFKLFDMYIASKEDLSFKGQAERIINNHNYVPNSTTPGQSLLRVERQYFEEHRGVQFFDMLFTIFSNIFYDDLDKPYGQQLVYFCFNRFKLEMSLYHGKLNILLGYILNSQLDREEKLLYFKIIFEQMHMHEASWLMTYSLAIDKSSNVFIMFRDFPETRVNAPNFHKWEYLLQV